MKPEELRREHQKQVAELRAAPAAANIALEKAAIEVGRLVRAEAARRGHSVGVRVVRKPSGVRVTVTGPRATHYRAAVEKALKDRLPQATAEIRAQLTRKAR